MSFNKEIIQKYLGGWFSLNDKRIVDEYFTDNTHSHELDRTLKDHWETLAEQEISHEKELDNLLYKVAHRIHLHSHRPVGKAKKLWLAWSSIAAVLVLPLLVIAVCQHFTDRSVQQSTWVELHSPSGSRIQFSLPDGSTGWLNGGSILKYPARFKGERTVILNGEAYFDVIKDPGVPFSVNTRTLTVLVRGTSFNVVSFDKDSIMEVTVASGKVEVEGKDMNFKQEVLPSHRLVANHSQKSIKQSKVDVQNYISWKTGKLQFYNDNLDEVMRKISRFYNVDFEIAGNVNRTHVFRAILEDENLEETLRFMRLTMPITYSIRERVLNPDGTVSKRKIIISGKTKK